MEKKLKIGGGGTCGGGVGEKIKICKGGGPRNFSFPPQDLKWNSPNEFIGLQAPQILTVRQDICTFK